VDAHRLYRFLVTFHHTQGRSPSYHEIAEEFGIVVSSASYWVKRLEQEGVLTRVGQGARGSIFLTGELWLSPEAGRELKQLYPEAYRFLVEREP